MERGEMTICCAGCPDSKIEDAWKGRWALRCMAQDAGRYCGSDVIVYSKIFDVPPGGPAPYWCPRREIKAYP